MITRFFLINRNIIIMFLILAIIVVLLQFNLLDLALKIGFKPDDWALYFKYRTLGETSLFNISEVWRERGIYTTYQIYYMGLLESLVGFDYRSFQVVNLIFKVLGTIAVFPLVLVIFKSKLLASLTTLLFSVSAASVGPLEFVVKGSDYVAIFWMCIFLIVYYLIARDHSRNFLWVIISLILLVLTLMFSPIRLFPLLILLPLVEIYLLVKNRNFNNLKKILIRMLVMYLPFVILFIHSPGSILGFMQSPADILNRITRGDWHLILVPFSGIGLTFITNQYYAGMFGSLTIDSLQKYIYFLLGRPTVMYGFLTLLVAFSKSKKPWSFFLFTFILNFILEIFAFFIVVHSKYSPSIQGLNYEPTELYSALFGIYILVLGFTCFIEWIMKKESDNLLMAFWIGSLFLFIFTFFIWIFAPFGTGFSGTSYYLVVSAIGASLFMAAFLLSLYNKAINSKNVLLKIIFLMPLEIFVLVIFLMNSAEIHLRINYLLNNGRSAEGQQLLQKKFMERLGNFDNSKPALFYFDTSDLSEDGSFYTEGFLGSFPFWMHFQDNKLTDGCLEILYLDEHKQLLPYIKEQDGQKGFSYKGLCVENGKSGYKDIFYTPENFYAFKIQNRDFIDIRKELLKELRF